MSAPLARMRFHLALYAAFLGVRRGRFAEISKASLAPAERVPKSLKVYFWTPASTAGANVIVHDMLPSLRKLVGETAPGWEIHFGDKLPEQAMDWLVCFKAVPDATKVCGQPRRVLLICDQAEVYWDRLREFEAIVATSSRPFASLLAARHPHVTFISESEPPDFLAFGRKNLATAPASRGNVLLWHGGTYSQDALNELRPVLSEWAAQSGAQLHVVSGQAKARVEEWAALTVNYFPWSKAQLRSSAAESRLGFVPARFSLKKSWLKPASRVRCLYALGVPAIGDDRVPDVAEFMAVFNGPLAGRVRRWLDALTSLWNDAATLARFAASGHATVVEKFSTEQTARQWLRYLSQPTRR